MIFGAIYSAMTGRSSKWPKVRDAHLAANPRCVACGQQADTVHHLRPVAVAPAMELDANNLASVCDDCHFCIGHICNWQLWNDLFWQSVQVLNRGRRGKSG
mgnify:CR=1 FL=1